MVLPRKHVHFAARALPLGAVALLLPACQSEVFGGKDTYSPAVEKHDYAQEKIDAGPRKGDVYGPGQRDPGAVPVDEFSAALIAFQPTPTSIACLPLVNLDLKAGRPWVSELGIETSDSVARALREKGFAGSALASDDMSLRLAQANLARESLTSLEAVAASADRLGAEVVVFGTIRRRDHAGALDRDVLTCELQAYDVAGQRIATSARWEIPSDEPNFRRVWDLAQTESAWMANAGYAPPRLAPSLPAELKRTADDLAASLARTLGPATFEGSVYVAPLDVSAFAPELAMLRAAQSAYSSELTRRLDAGVGQQQEPDLSGKIVLAGTEFPNLQSAEAYLTQLSAGFQATNAARVARSFSASLGDALRTRLESSGRAVHDLASVKLSDPALVEGDLVQGGMARSAAARDVLQVAGIGVVVAARLEKLGDAALQIRADAYDLKTGANTGSGKAMIPSGLVAEFQRALAPDPSAHPTAALSSSPAGGQWSALYDSVKSGVVHVSGSEGRGSGFVVRDDGLVMTNHHVATGIGSSLTVTAEGGSPLPARVVATDAYWDLAAIQVDGLPKTCHVFGFADEVRVGTEVAVLGNPRDSSGWVLTPGYVSSTSEQIGTADGRTRAALMYTSATRAGSSGSPVLLADGRVAAVHSAGRVGQSLTDTSERTELTGFALGIPAREARLFAEKIARP